MNGIRLSETMKGSLLIAGGFILLLHSMGILKQSVDQIIMFGSIGMVVYGIVKAGFHKKIPAMLQKRREDDF